MFAPRILYSTIQKTPLNNRCVNKSLMLYFPIENGEVNNFKLNYYYIQIIILMHTLTQRTK